MEVPQSKNVRAGNFSFPPMSLERPPSATPSVNSSSIDDPGAINGGTIGGTRSNEPLRVHPAFNICIFTSSCSPHSSILSVGGLCFSCCRFTSSNSAREEQRYYAKWCLGFIDHEFKPYTWSSDHQWAYWTNALSTSGCFEIWWVSSTRTALNGDKTG